MASIPLPALDVRSPQPQENQLDQYARLMQIKNQMQMAPLQQQALQQQIQAGQLDVQQKRLDLQARQALQAASANSLTKDSSGNMTFDPDKFQQGIAGTPAFTPETIENLTKMQQARVGLQNSMADLQGKQQDMMGSAANAIKASGYNPSVAHGILDSFFANPAMANSPQAQQIRATIDNPQALKQWVDGTISQSPKQQGFQNAKDVAALRANTPEMQGMNAWLAQNPGKTAADYQQHKIDMQTQATVARETNPQVIAAKEQVAGYEAQMRQALSQGDPKAAGQLLVNGDATLAELKSRGATPDFIARALFAAHQLSGGQYNAQQAEAQFDVAKSPANVAFFGSAKSLTDKGGTLDQLAAAGQNLPQAQIPVLNSIADWEKAATGRGPIAHYAATALGVADDYAKVMGGGQGSDTSRLQALNLIKANMSPEGRTAAIEGIRGAVGSQTASRIGNNKVMQRMYGDVAAPANSGNSGAAPLTVKAPNGKTYTFKDQASADAFKKSAGIQ